MIAGLARLVLALALLAGWQLALVHPLRHFDAQGGYVHLGGEHSKDRKSGRAEGLCDVIAGLVACVSGKPPLPLPMRGKDASAASFDAAAFLAAAAPPFLSQGPPFLS